MGYHWLVGICCLQRDWELHFGRKVEGRYGLFITSRPSYESWTRPEKKALKTD
jgi:hypothetical protein